MNETAILANGAPSLGRPTVMGYQIVIGHAAIVQKNGPLSRTTDGQPGTLPFMSRILDEDFGVLLQKAAAHAHVPYKQTEIGNRLGVNRQTVDTWMKGSFPRPDMLFKIADSFGVDARWLATGEGEMLSAANRQLSPEEEDLLARYKNSDPRWRLSLRLLACVATEDIQNELAGDVNMLLARVFGKKPGQLKYASNQRVGRALGAVPTETPKSR